jgi:hypothetical protein
MKKIRALTDSPVVINKMTIDRDHPMDVWNEEILKWEDVKQLLEEKKIEIVDGG